MTIFISFYGNTYVFVDECNQILYKGNLSSGWVIFGIKKKLVKGSGEVVADANEKEMTIGNQKTELIYTNNGWECLGANDDYFFVPHKGYSVSILKGGTQIGYYKQSALFGSTDPFLSIAVNSNCDLDFICSCIFTIVCNFDENEAININMGTWFLKENKPFDNDWAPI